MPWERLDRELLRRAFSASRTAQVAGETRWAAVAALLAERSRGVELLLIQRSVRENDPWSGHMALPGGHAEPQDRDLFETALRETQEELGVELSESAEHLGQLDDLVPMRGYGLVVRPFVFALRSLPTLVMSPEVDATVWVPMADIESGVLAREHPVVVGGVERRFPAFAAGEQPVWGLTYRVIQELIGRASAAPGTQAETAGRAQLARLERGS